MEDSQKDFHTKKIILLPIIVALLLACISVCSVLLLVKYNKQETEERTAVISGLAVETASLVDKDIIYSEDETLYCETEIQKNQPTDLEHLYSVLAEINTNAKTSAYMVAFSEQNHYYFADQHVQGTEALAEDFSIASITDHQTVISDLTNGTACVLSIKKLDTPIEVQSDIVITHVAAALDISSFESVFGDEELYRSCAIYLTDIDGTSLYYNPSKSSTGSGVDNVIEALSQRQFISGTVDELKESIQTCSASETVTMKFERDDGNWYLSATNAEQGDLAVFVFAPEDAITTSKNGILTEMIVLIIAFALCIFALVLVFAAVQYRIKFNRHMRGNNGPYNPDQYPTVPSRSYDGDENAVLPPDIEAQGSDNSQGNVYYAQGTQTMKEPVTNIVGMTNHALQNRVDVAGLEDCLFKINGTSNRLLTLVSDMVDMSKLDNGAMVLEKNSFQMRSLIENCASMLSGRLLLRNIGFTCDFAPLTHTRLYGDEVRLRQILLNLLSYAEGCAAEGDSIRFGVSEGDVSEMRAEYQFVVEVSAGISDKSREHLFEPFWQEEEGTANMLEGKGLGLTVAKRLVDLMGGTITVENTAEQGSRFVVKLAFGIDDKTVETYPVEELASDASAISSEEVS
jgi:hypothetical protein